MPHQSTIRKTALSLIYALLEQRCEDISSFPLQEFWEIALEKEHLHLQQALTGAVLHVCRSAEDLAAPVLKRGRELIAYVPQIEITHVLSATENLLRALGKLRAIVGDKRRNSVTETKKMTDLILRSARQLDEKSEIVLSGQESTHTAPFFASLRRWQKILHECATLEDPIQIGSNVEYAGLSRCAKELAILRPQAENLALDVYSHREEWEACLQRLLRNYIPQRLDTVDRAILYLSLHELKYRGLDAPIVISEANNLAHEFSGSKSSPFVHGVLAAAVEELASPQ